MGWICSSQLQPGASRDRTTVASSIVTNSPRLPSSNGITSSGASKFLTWTVATGAPPRLSVNSSLDAQRVSQTMPTIMPPAHLVVLGATVEPIARLGGPPPDAVAITNGSISGIGARADVEPLIGPATEVLRLNGETLLPGFQDAHIHPVQGELTAARCDLSELTADRFHEAIRAYAATLPDRDWAVGAGWSTTDFPDAAPLRTELDKLVGDRPAFLWSRDGH